MDADYLASKIHSAKHLSAFLSAKHISAESHLALDDTTEAHEDTRTYVTCPFCYIDTDLTLLCSHLQEEHCFDVKDAVCPVCAMNLGKDVATHFRMHHGSSLKNRRKSDKSTFWRNNIEDLRSFYSLAAKAGAGNLQDFSPDPLLAPFLCSVSYSDPKPDIPQEKAATISNTEGSNLIELRREDYEDRMQKAEFIQQMMLSAMV